MSVFLAQRARARPATGPDRTPRSSRQSVVAALLVLAAEGLVVADLGVVVLRPLVSLTVLLGLPTLVLARRGRWATTDADDVRAVRALLYAFGVSVAGVMVGGLVLNTVLPLLGVDRPLDRVPVALASTAADLALLCWRRSVPLVEQPRTTALWCLRARLDPAVALALVALVAGVTGAVRLNNGSSGAVAVLGHVVVGLAVAVLLLRPLGSAARDALVVYLGSASLLLATSLRGWSITGHDIQREYLVFLLTDQPGRWSMGSFDNAYNACLSLNILPTVLAEHTGLSGVVVFKVVTPLLFAAVPVMVLAWSRRLISRRTAVLATLLFISFPTFFNDMPYLSRQEVAFFFVSLALMAGQEHSWSIWSRRGAVVGFGSAVVLSHYSTTYVMLSALAAASVGATLGPVLTRLWRRWRGTSDPADYVPRVEPGLALAHPAVVVALVAATWLWTSPATHSGGHLVDTVASAVSGLTGGSSGPGSGDLQYGLFAGHQATPQQRMDLFVKSTLQTRAAQGGRGFTINDFSPGDLEPPLIDTANLPTTPVGDALDRTPVSAFTFNSDLRLLSAGLLQVFLMVGMIVLVLRRRATRRFGREARWLCVGMLAGLAAQVLVPGLSVDYGILRAFQQALLLLAPVVAVGLVTSLAWLRRWAGPTAAVAGLVMFATLTGVVARVTGGFPGQLALASSGQYYDLYYISPAEQTAMDWLAVTSQGAPIQAEDTFSDKFAATREAELGGPVETSSEFYPTLLKDGSWVFYGGQNVTKQQSTVFYTGNLLTYLYPIDELNEHLDLVYANTEARVYR